MAIGIGVELGPSTIRGVVLERSGAALTLRAVHELPCETTNAEALTRTLTQLRTTLRISQPVILGLPTTSAILATIQPLIVNKHRAALAVQFELQQHLPFEVGEAAWHYHWLSAENGHAAEKRAGLRAQGSGQLPPAQSPQPRVSSSSVVVAAMKRARLEERLACCHRAGLQIRAVAINAVAMLNAWSLQRRTAPASGGALLHVLSEQSAEWITWTQSSLQVIPVASPSPQTLSQELAAAWDALQTQGSALPQSVWLIGSPPLSPSLEQTLASRAGLRIERFDVAQIVATPAAVQREAPERAVAALGLALQGLGLGRMSLNLLSSAQIHTHAQRVRQVSALTSGVCAVAAMGLGLNGMLEARHRRLLILQSLERQERLYQTLRPEIRSMLQRQRRIERRSLQLEQVAGESSLMMQWLAQIAQALPETVWLTKFECAKGAAVEGMLEGRAASFQEVSRFLNQLKNLEGMSAVKLLSNTVTTDPVSSKELIAFAVQLQRLPALPAAARLPVPSRTGRQTGQQAGQPPASAGSDSDQADAESLERLETRETPASTPKRRATKAGSRP